MTNLWGFLLQSISVTIVSLTLLLVKRIFQDKLSPRWQYGTWSVLALRLLIPVSVTRYFLLPVPLWIEQFKTIIEKNLNSAYISAYESIQLIHPFPLISKLPVSITDVLFVLYIMGVMLFGIKYIVSYFHLQRLIKQGIPVSSELELKLQQTAEKLGTKPCQALAIEGIQSAFVTGIFHPVLIVPYSESIDQKILMHELYHLKYYDALQNTFWCLMKCLHWCNPVMHLIFDYIRNDQEALCDQRVLEHLEGEQLREYGMILLKMANDKYACTIGTTSISNGGKNISKRIEAIARFKKYPKGMSIVSVCILLVLGGSVLQGNAYTITNSTYFPDSAFEFEQAMALTRIARCNTLAGAIDTYAKALILNNGLYLATASPASHQSSIIEQLSNNNTFYELDDNDLMNEIPYDSSYCIYNLKKIRDNLYSAALLIGKPYSTEDNDKCYRQDILITKEDDWCVLPEGQPELIDGGTQDVETWMNSNLGFIKEYEAMGEYGKVNVQTLTLHVISNATANTNSLFSTSSFFDTSLKTDAEFEYINTWTITDYDYSMIADEKSPDSYIEVQTSMVTSKDEEPEFLELQASPYSSGGSNVGQTSVRAELEYIRENCLRSAGGSSTSETEKFPFDDCYGFYVRIIWDGEIVEEIFLDGGTQ